MCFNTFAISVDSISNDALKQYQQNHFDKAEQLWKQIENDGYYSSSLYYNIGNAAFKQNKVAESIFYYEKALKLEPTNDDILTNLKIAKTKVVDEIKDIPTFFLTKWANKLSQQFNPNFWGFSAVFLFLIFFISTLVFIFTKKSSLRKLTFFTGLLGLILSFTFHKIGSRSLDNMLNSNEAIIFSSSVTVKSSPAESGNNLFTIHEGTKVKIMDKVSMWYEIKLNDGSVGWIKSETLKKI